MIRTHHAPRVVIAVAAALVGVAGVAAAATLWAVSLHASSTAEAQSLNPAAPAISSAVCASPASKKEVTLTFSSVTHATSYTLYHSSTSTGTYTSLVTGITASPYTTAALSAATYYFKIAAVFSTNWSSPESAATTTARVISSSSCS